MRESGDRDQRSNRRRRPLRGNGNARKPVFPLTRNRTQRKLENNNDDDGDDDDDNNYSRGDYIIFIINELGLQHFIGIRTL